MMLRACPAFAYVKFHQDTREVVNLFPMIDSRGNYLANELLIGSCQDSRCGYISLCWRK